MKQPCTFFFLSLGHCSLGRCFLKVNVPEVLSLSIPGPQSGGHLVRQAAGRPRAVRRGVYAKSREVTLSTLKQKVKVMGHSL